MAPRSFSRVELVYHAALARPAHEREAFVEKECQGDASLLEEVRSLLGYEAEARRLLEEPVGEGTTRKLAVARGSRLGPYEVLGLIGAGGMGEVYRARDTRLGREVAVKVLPEPVAKDPEALGRFAQETKAVAALSHAHICALYDVGREGEVDFAVMELLEGETLRERLSRGALAPKAVVELAIQTCRGLAAAHAKGIVHRDLKPENLFLTAEGVKILDFGLAKRTRGLEGMEETSPKTRSGVLLGTVGYLSPEQARGEPADVRSDVFALGAVLFEMLSGRRAFKRDTHAETLAAILKEDPPELVSPRGPLPPGLERIVGRCLEKRPDDRFQSAHDLALALEAVSGVSAPGRPGTGGGRRWVWAAALVVAAAVAGLWIAWPGDTTHPPLRVRPITSDPGAELDPALSPDGNQVAYVKLQAGRQDLFVKLIGGGEPLLVSQGSVHSIAPAWSPDGRQIAFLRPVEGEPGELTTGLYVVPALGGTERLLATSRGRSWVGLAWSPDQTTLAIADTESPEEPGSIFLLSSETGERRKVTNPPAGYVGDTFPRFSPDGRTLAFVRVRTVFDTDVYVVATSGGNERRLTFGNLQTSGLDWAPDGESIVFASWRNGGADVVSLWRVPVAGGDLEVMEFGENGWWPTISRRGGRLAYVREESRQDIWRAGGPAAPEGERSPTRLISSTRRDFHARYSPDGKQIAFASWRSGASEIWVCESNGSSPRQLTFLDGPLNTFPTWSPDGQRVAFTALVEGGLQFYVVGVSGGVPRRLATGSSFGPISSWSPDGRWLYFFSNQSGRHEVWKIPSEGGDAIQVTTHGGTWASESPDGRFLYFTKSSGPEVTPGIWRVPMDGGEEVQVLDRGRAAYWGVVERGIVFLNDSSPLHALEFFDSSTGEVSRLTELEVPAGYPGLSASPDGRWVLYSGVERSEADIMLVENFK